MKIRVSLAAGLLCLAPPAFAQTANSANQACASLTDAQVISADGHFLGTVSSPYDSGSIFNRVGKESSPDSIWNRYSDYGSPYSSNSALNPFAGTPPLLMKKGKVLGHLTKNGHLPDAIDPMALANICFEYTPEN